MANTTTTQVPKAVNNHLDRTLLSRAYPYFVHALWGQVRDIPRNGSETIKFRKYGSLSAATTALSEGVTPSGSQLSITDITSDVAQYGDFVVTTDFLDMTVIEPLKTELAQILGDQMGETIDILVRDVITAGSTVQFAGVATSRNTVLAGMVLNSQEVRDAVETLQNNNAKPFTRVVRPSNGFNTSPIDSSYIGIISPKTLRRLKEDSEWIPVAEYAQSDSRLGPFEKGALDDVRFVVSSNAKTQTNSDSLVVQQSLIMGQEYYGISRVSGEEVEVIVKSAKGDSVDRSDPLNQRSTMGWKISFVATRLQEDFAVRIEHAGA